MCCVVDLMHVYAYACVCVCVCVCVCACVCVCVSCMYICTVGTWRKGVCLPYVWKLSGHTLLNKVNNATDLEPTDCWTTLETYIIL